MKKLKYIKSSLMLLVCLLIINSCKKNDNVVVKDVVFTVDVNSYVVTFTNTTTDAKAFKWNFGDSTTSTDRSPVHTYKAKGKYVATLTATLNSGTTISGSTIINVSKSSPIKLDDNSLGDWDTISTVVTPTAKLGGVVQEAKFDYDSQNVYIYMKLAVQVADANVFDFYLDSDGNSATGLTTGSIPGGGYNFLMEGNLLSDHNSLGLYQHDDSGGQDAWAWNQQSIAEYYKVGTVQEVNGVTTFEMSISRGKLSGLTGKAMKLAIIVSSSGWAELGYMPGQGQAPFSFDISQ